MDFIEVRNYFINLQKRIIDDLALKDNAIAERKTWESKLGNGVMMQLSGGDLFERGGVNFSCIAADKMPPAASKRHPDLAGQPYQACGVSLVMHPHNPFCPTVHMNVRCFVTDNHWWFGGGLDLTPYYGFAEDCQHFHQTLKDALDKHDTAHYPLFKKQCDDYFYIPHRQEARGIGGIFFDDYTTNNYKDDFLFLQAVGNSFLPAYQPIIDRRKALTYTDAHKQWQQHRRGRYVEFNLVHDRGTLFGLQSGGNADSILMSLPPTVSWGSAPLLSYQEESLVKDFLPPREWAIR